MKACSPWIILLALVFAGAEGIHARPAMRVNTYLSYTDNLFQNYSRRPDWVTLTYVDLDYAPGPSVNLYYTGNANVFAEYQDLFSHNHQVGLGYVRQGEGRNAFYSGVEAMVRMDKPAYQYYDYFQGNVYANAKRYLRPTLLSRAGYRLRYRTYLHAEDYSFLEHSAFMQVSRFLQTRTTVQAQAGIGVKTYTRRAAEDSIGAVPTRAGGERTLAQATLKLKVAQAVAHRTGVQVEYVRYVNFLGRNRYAQTEGYNTDDDLFDDRYSYAGDEIQVGVKHLMSWGLRLEVSGRLVHRNYEGRPALDLNGFLIGPDLTREDTRKSVGTEAEKTFRVAWGPVRELGVRTEWLYLDKDSNDPYYKTTVQIYSIGIQMGF